MCSFIFTNLKLNNELIEAINKYLKYRGPDRTNVKEINDYTFIHNLLHITGEMIIQPFIKNDVVCLFNGEIYNYKSFGNYRSDGECLIDLYEKFGDDFFNKLDGEFAICLLDFKKNMLYFTRDIFGTKPIYYNIDENNITIATYESALNTLKCSNIREVKNNTIYIHNINNSETKTKILHHFNFSRQYKTTYEDWEKAFLNSVKKRINNENRKKFICLSSGYDSGCICLAANLLNENYKTFTINAREDLNIIKARQLKNDKESYQIHFIKSNYLNTRQKLDKIIEPILYYSKTEIYNKNSLLFPPRKYSTDMYILDDKASIGLSYICDIASNEGYRIFLSGQGADEIYADYGFNGKDSGGGHTRFGGRWPSNMLCEINGKKFISNDVNDDVIWDSFFKSPQRNYIMKEDCVSGAHGIEGRFPYLDKDVVQEFLWLDVKLKNQIYKAPLDFFLQKHKYPYNKGKKIGFKADYAFHKNL